MRGRETGLRRHPYPISPRKTAGELIFHCKTFNYENRPVHLAGLLYLGCSIHAFWKNLRALAVVWWTAVIHRFARRNRRAPPRIWLDIAHGAAHRQTLRSSVTCFSKKAGNREDLHYERVEGASTTKRLGATRRRFCDSIPRREPLYNPL